MTGDQEVQEFTVEELQDIEDRARQMLKKSLRSDDQYARMWMYRAFSKLLEGTVLLKCYMAAPSS